MDSRCGVREMLLAPRPRWDILRVKATPMTQGQDASLLLRTLSDELTVDGGLPVPQYHTQVRRGGAGVT